MDKGIHLVMWFFVGCVVLAILTHAAGFATAVTAVGGQVTGAGALLSGQGANRRRGKG